MQFTAFSAAILATVAFALPDGQAAIPKDCTKARMAACAEQLITLDPGSPCSVYAIAGGEKVTPQAIFNCINASKPQAENIKNCKACLTS